METIYAIVLGFVQGLTEFLPVSSTGHLILMREALGINTASGLAYDAVLQVATALAVLVYFYKDLVRLFHALLRLMGRLPVDEKDRVLLIALIVGTIPGVVLGVLLEDLMETAFRSPLLVAAVLVAGSVLFAVAEYISARIHERKVLTIGKGFWIGFFQALALVPGMSRSGASIAGGLILGLTRYEAARFSFLLAIPIILGSGGKKLLELVSANEPTALVPLAIGSAVAFIVGISAIHFMLGFVRRHTLWPFIWYRLALAAVIVAVVFFG